MKYRMYVYEYCKSKHITSNKTHQNIRLINIHINGMHKVGQLVWWIQYMITEKLRIISKDFQHKYVWPRNNIE